MQFILPMPMPIPIPTPITHLRDMTLGPSLRILFAEDNKSDQWFTSSILGKYGHTVDIASNGVAAVEAVSRGDYDIVLMDIQMPELDGVAATKQIRALPEPKCRIPIVAMTADAMSGARDKYLAAGMDAYISKPFEVETLMALIGCLTRIHRAYATPKSL